MNLTGWFRNINPEYIGVYERLVFDGLNYIKHYSYWEGYYWAAPSYTIDGAKLNRNIVALNQSALWRGIASVCP